MWPHGRAPGYTPHMYFTDINSYWLSAEYIHMEIWIYRKKQGIHVRKCVSKMDQKDIFGDSTAERCRLYKHTRILYILIFGIFFVKFGFTCFQNNQLSIVFFFSRKPMILNNRVWYVKSKYQTKHEMINRHDIRYQCVKYFLLSHYKLDVLSSSIFQSIKQGPIRQYINKW